MYIFVLCVYMCVLHPSLHFSMHFNPLYVIFDYNSATNTLVEAEDKKKKKLLYKSKHVDRILHFSVSLAGKIRRLVPCT